MQKDCERCGKPFPLTAWNRRFCGPSCNVMAHLSRRKAGVRYDQVERSCTICDSKFVGNVDRRYCSKRCRAKRNQRVHLEKYHATYKHDAQFTEKQRVSAKARKLRDRMAAFVAYGGSWCACCGETEAAFLTIDHVNGGGAEHRRQIRGHIYVWLKINEYPDGFQVLCFNCNSAKYLLGQCPHLQASALTTAT